MAATTGRSPRMAFEGSGRGVRMMLGDSGMTNPSAWNGRIVAALGSACQAATLLDAPLPRVDVRQKVADARTDPTDLLRGETELDVPAGHAHALRRIER